MGAVLDPRGAEQGRGRPEAGDVALGGVARIASGAGKAGLREGVGVLIFFRTAFVVKSVL